MNKKIKVLECIRQGQIGGGESHLLSLVENMDRNRFDPVVLSFTDGPMIDRLKRMNLPCHIIQTLKPIHISKSDKIVKGKINAVTNKCIVPAKVVSDPGKS